MTHSPLKLQMLLHYHCTTRPYSHDNDTHRNNESVVGEKIGLEEAGMIIHLGKPDRERTSLRKGVMRPSFSRGPVRYTRSIGTPGTPPKTPVPLA